jgi:hypothetical protein
MTKKQTEVVEWLRGEILRRDGYPGDELKRFYVQEFPEFVAVSATVGMSGDEGTAAALTRYSRQVYIGPRGGLSHYVNGKRRRLPWSDTMPAQHTSA